MTATPFFAQAEAAYALLDDLPRGLWLGALTHALGHVKPRLEALRDLRAALIAGEPVSSADLPWPAATLAAALVSTLDALELPRFCCGQPDLAEQVLRSLSFHLDRIVDYRDRGASAERAEGMAVEAFADEWRDRCGAMDELIEVFGELGETAGSARWDLLRGVLQSGGWREVVRIRRLLERLPEVSALIRSLGRAVPADEVDAGCRLVAEIRETGPAPRARHDPIRVPDLPGETRGVQRSGRVARMLAGEAVLLNHPKLRRVWHARHAERALLTYEDDDRMDELRRAMAVAPKPRPQPVPERRLECGPLLLCVDTSGSMQGGAEAVAKAVVLEAMRTARAQRRACHVFAFGGPDEIVELELELNLPGVTRLADFLGQAFRGGTDICGPIERALDKLAEARWAQADLVIASDGEFGATPAIARRLQDAKRTLGLRVQGVLIGDRETIGLLELADEVFWVRDWRRFGTSHADSPVHASNLTAMYFPGAIRSEANRQATVSGPSATEAVRRGLRREPR